MERLLNRAGSLIDGAGGGDWNREEPDWQLAAAAWKRDLQAMHEPTPVFELEPGLPAVTAVMRALGAASSCWSDLRGAGEFDSTRAEQIGQTLLAHLRAYPADSSRDLVARAWHLLRQVPENAAGPEFEAEAHQLGSEIAAHGWFLPQEPVDPTEPISVEQVYASTVAATVDVDGQEYAVEVTNGATRIDLGDDPDGDIAGYDGPMGKPGGYCTTRSENAEPHLPGTVADCPTCGHWYTTAMGT